MAPTDAPEPEMPFDVSVEEVKAWLDRGDDIFLIDCRTPDEHRTAAIAAARLIPMQELAARWHDLGVDPTQHIVVHCHHGGRSQRVTAWLRQQGYTQAQNMAGGIDAWSERIDPQVPRY